ncbi:MAG: VWA domain-containing protein [Candidatus Obscuribacterales bacterium]|nr:VWA domain-containing protein [Candidatus Obscuribacterales bacterium]
MIQFMNLYLLGLVPVVLALVYLASRRRKSYGHTQVATQKNLRSMFILSRLPIICLSAFLVLLCLAIARPVVPESKTTQTMQTRDFMIAVDISGSMDSDIADPDQKALVGDPNTTQLGEDGKPVKITRLTVAKAAIDKFIPTREGDRIGLILFDDEAYFSWPLTTDLQLLLKRNSRLGKYTGGGTNFDGPDDAGFVKMGPIQASIDHFKELGQAKSKVIVMVSDGEASIKPERMQQLLDQLKQGNIKLYVLGVSDGWVKDSPMVQDLKKLSVDSGGKVIPVGDAAALRAGFDEINALEKSQVEVETSTTFRDIFHLFLIAAAIMALAFTVTAALVREDV